MGVGVVTLWGVMVSWDSAVGAGIPATGVTGRVTCGKGSNSDGGRGAEVLEPAQAANDIATSSKARSMGTLVPENPA
ncbi:MAG: hypothetical protein IH962_00820 [Chloroflexi bacterium]|nr:hypothetical protein [Chloroflexota bacterium]